MPFEVTILGTSSMVPTKERNVQALFLERKGDGILFDCGEGTQRQMNIAGINRNKVKTILLTHWHGDHVAGLIGLLQTVGHQLGQKQDEYAVEKGEKATLNIYGPRGTEMHMAHLVRSVTFEQGKIDVKVHELPMVQDKFYENEEYELWCIPLKHSTPVLGYAFVEKDKRRMDMKRAEKLGLKPGRKIGQLQRGETVKHDGKEIAPEMVGSIVKGKKFTLIPDTKLCNEAIKLAEGSDLLVCESSFGSELEEKARKFRHLTAEHAASIAQQAGAKRLILTHFSQRYKQVDALVKEAKVLFPDVEAAFDLMKVKV